MFAYNENHHVIADDNSFLGQQIETTVPTRSIHRDDGILLSNAIEQGTTKQNIISLHKLNVFSICFILCKVYYIIYDVE